MGFQTSKQKDNIRRFDGVNATDAVAYSADRATFFVIGSPLRVHKVTIPLPAPLAMGGKAQPHSLSATLAWFTPVAPGRMSDPACRLKFLKLTSIRALGADGHGWQLDENQTNHGTIFSRCWEGNNAPVVTADMTISLIVQREPDQVTTINEPVVFGLAVTLTMPDEFALYDEVYARVQPPIRVAARLL